MVYIVTILLVVLLAEFTARKRYLKKHSLPFKPKRIGEYPYNEFINECGPPLYWTLKQGYASKQVHINSLGQRGPEPEPRRRKIWVVGESDLFGAKLLEEKDIWFKVMQTDIDKAGYDYQVMNASIIGYNGYQTAESVVALPIESGDILLVRPNLNNLSIAGVYGSDWEPSTPWPMAFVHKLQSYTPWYRKVVDQSCLGIALRRKFAKTDEKAKYFAPKPGFNKEKIFEHTLEQLNRMVTYGKEKSADVAILDFAFSYGPTVRPDEEGKLSAIQSNWRFYADTWGKLQYELVKSAIRNVAQPEGLPVLRIASHILEHPHRYQLFIDVVHFNADGHEVYAKALFSELCDKKLLKRKNNEQR